MKIKSAKNKILKLILACFGLLAVLFLLSFLNWPAAKLKDVSHAYLQRPVFSVFNFLGEKTSRVLIFFEGLYFGGREIRELKEINTALYSQNVRLKEIVKENQFLKESLNIVEGSKQKLIVARVIAKDQNISNSILVIDRGSQDAVAVGQTVIAGPSILLGRVFETGESFSKVRLLTDPQSQVNVFVQGTDLQGIVSGQYGLGLLLEKVPWARDLEVGSLVLSSGVGGDFPNGLLIGQIKEKVASEAAPHQTARITPATQVEVLDFVFVVE